MMEGLFIVTLIMSGVEYIKEKLEPEVPLENWSNKELYYEDMMNGVPMKQITKNLQNGKYKQTYKYPEPHRNSDGKIIIENCKLYNEDLRKYGSVQVNAWIKQGKYNLSPEELEKERQRIKKELENLCKI